MVLTGDSLLVADVGRPDFGGGDPSAQFQSVTCLLRLPDWVVAVSPGHFEGLCGKGMGGRPSTTIGFERLYNPLERLYNPLLYLEHDPFVSRLTNGVPARPLNMSAIEATNHGLADMPQAMLKTTPAVAKIDIDALERRSTDTVVVDVCEPEKYAHGHVSRAVNLPQADLALRLGELPRDRLLLTICRSGSRSQRAAQFLKQAGFDQEASVKVGTATGHGAGKRLAFSDTSGVDEPRIMESTWVLHASTLACLN
jgi:sulfur dioxygenase